MSCAASWKLCADVIADGSLNFWKPMTESASWR